MGEVPVHQARAALGQGKEGGLADLPAMKDLAEIGNGFEHAEAGHEAAGGGRQRVFRDAGFGVVPRRAESLWEKRVKVTFRGNFSRAASL